MSLMHENPVARTFPSICISVGDKKNGKEGNMMSIKFKLTPPNPIALYCLYQSEIAIRVYVGTDMSVKTI